MVPLILPTISPEEVQSFCRYPTVNIRLLVCTVSSWWQARVIIVSICVTLSGATQNSVSVKDEFQHQPTAFNVLCSVHQRGNSRLSRDGTVVNSGCSLRASRQSLGPPPPQGNRRSVLFIELSQGVNTAVQSCVSVLQF